MQGLFLENELSWDPRTATANIEVRALDGTVTLCGEVDSFAVSSIAEEIVRELPGVKSVINELRIELDPEDCYSDIEIAAMAMDSLRRCVPKASEIEIDVCGGWIVMRGYIASTGELAAASLALRDVGGVRGVRNMLAVHFPFSDRFGSHFERHRNEWMRKPDAIRMEAGE